MAVKSAWFSFALSFFLIQCARSQAVTDFTNYPANSRGCLSSAASSSKCPTDTVPNFNGCVCSNGGNFVQSAVQCLTASDSGDLASVYATMSSNCATSNTPLPFTLQQFLALGGTGTTTTPNNPSTTTVTGLTTVSQQGTTKVQTFVSTVTPGQTTSAVVTTIVVTPTGSGQATPFTSIITIAGGQGGQSTSTSAPANGGVSGSNSGSGSKLSTTAIIGMGVGIPLFFALVGLIATLCWCQRRRERKSHAIPPPAPAGYVPPPQQPVSQVSRPQSSVTTFTNNTLPVAAAAGYETKQAQQHRFSNMSYQKPTSPGPDPRWSQQQQPQLGVPAPYGMVAPQQSPSPQSWQNTPSPQPNWAQPPPQQHMYGAGGGVAPSELPANVQQQSPTVQELPGQQPYGYH